MRISDWSSDVCSSDLGGRVPGLHLLLVTARPAFDRAPPKQEQVRVRSRRGQVEAERVVRIERGDHQRALGVVVVDAGVGAEEERLGRGLVGRFALVVAYLGVAAAGRGEVEAHLADNALWLGRGRLQMEGRGGEA